jgi:ATP-binding cassette subfamily B protein
MFQRFWSYYRQYKKLFVLDFSCAVGSAILELGFPLFVSFVVDKLLPGKNWPLFLAACIVMFAVCSINAVLQFIVNYWGHMLGINIETDMRRKLFDHVQKLSFRFFDNTKTGHLMSRLSTDLFDIDG